MEVNEYENQEREGENKKPIFEDCEIADPSEKLPHIIDAPRVTDDTTLNEEGVDISEALKEDNTVVLEEPIPADHTYDSNHSYWALAYKDLEKTSKKQKRQILKLERQLRMANLRLTQYKAGKLPKVLVKKVCHDNLIGPGKFLTKNQYALRKSLNGLSSFFTYSARLKFWHGSDLFTSQSAFLE